MLLNKVGEQNLFKPLGLFSLAFFFSLSLSANDGTFADFKRIQTNSFQSFKDEHDEVFNKYLKKAWEAYLAQGQFSAYEEKKPRDIYPARKKQVKKQGPKINIVLPKSTANSIKPKELEVLNKSDQKLQALDVQNKTIMLPVVDEQEREQKDIEFDFYGTQVSFNLPLEMEKGRFYPQSKEGIRNFHALVSNTEYENIVKLIEDLSNDLHLNDWGKYLLVNEISKAVFPMQDEARLLSWFLFNKLGYDVKTALAGNHVLVLFNSKKLIYSTPNYKIDKKRYFLLSHYGKGSAGRVFTYKGNYPKSEKTLDLSMKELPHFKEDLQNKSLKFKVDTKNYSIEYRYNKNLIDFMGTYPQADYDTFFNTPMYAKSYEDIAKQIKKHTDGKHATEALNFVLSFVQSAFNYEVDEKQFGREKVMFADETLFFDKSDCEDRAILYSSLVKKLFKIGVVGVKYKDHMATALYIPINGDSVKVNSKRFVIADPTYINASVGQSMPKYKRKRPESFIYLRQNNS